MHGDKDKSSPDDFDPTIDPFSGEPILSRDEMDAIGIELKEKKAQRTQANSLPASGWFIATRVARNMGTGADAKKFKTAWSHLLEQAKSKPLKEDGTVEVLLEDKTLLMGYFLARGGNPPTWYLHESSIPILTPYCRYATELPSQDWLNSKAVRSALRITPNQEYLDMWRHLISAAQQENLTETGFAEVALNGQKVKIGFFKKFMRESWFISKDSIPVLANYLGKTVDTQLLPDSGWLGFVATGKQLGFNSRNSIFRNAWFDSVKRAENLNVLTGGAINVALGNKKVTMGYFHCITGDNWYISENSVPILADYLRYKIPAKTRTSTVVYEGKLGQQISGPHVGHE